jgi:hypothetical protein
VIHCIYIPWNQETSAWKADEQDFDHSWMTELQKQVQREGWTVRCWTRSDLQQLDPELWKTVTEAAVYATQVVDFYRWHLLEQFGGMYVQYGTTLNYSMAYYVPSTVNKTLRVFTEAWFPWGFHRLWYSQRLWAIRHGQSEESLRISNGFSIAIPHHPQIQILTAQILQRMQRMKPQDYDVLYIGANAYLSEFYDQHLQFDATVERVSWPTTLQLFSVCSRGSWRIDSLSAEKRQAILSTTVATRS